MWHGCACQRAYPAAPYTCAYRLFTLYHPRVSSEPLLDPVVLTSAPTEFAAQTIIHALSEEGIRAWSIGGMPMEVASFAKVMVLRADLELAKAVLDVIRREAAEMDWESMDEQELGVLSTEDEAMLQQHRRRMPVAGLMVAGLGVATLAGQRTMFHAMPPAARPVPGCLLIAAGLVWCYAVRSARRR